MVHAGANVSTFEEQALSNTFWGAVKIGVPLHSQFLNAWEQRVLKVSRGTRFTLQGISSILWAYGELKKIPPSELLESFGVRLIKLLRGGTKKVEGRVFGNMRHRQADDPQSLANIVWSLARLNYKPSDDFFIALKAEVSRQVDKFNSHDLTNSIWAFCVLEVSITIYIFLKCEGQCNAHVYVLRSLHARHGSA